MRFFGFLLLAIPTIICVKMRTRQADDAKCEDMTTELNCGMLPHCYFDATEQKCLKKTEEEEESSTSS
jgi:hypothetical protein